jgi:hypothetical protein
MVTRVQGKAFGKGMVAAIERSRDRVTSIIEIDHVPSIASQSLLKGVTHWLAASGAVNMAHTSIRLGDTHDDATEALQRSEEMRDRYRMLYEQAQQQLDALKAQGGDAREWITMTALAERQNVCHTTIWRAHKAGRLVTKPNGGGSKKSQYLCDPATYVSATKKITKTKS